MLSLFTKINFYFLIQVRLLLYILFIILLYVYVDREADQFEIGTNATMWTWGSPVATKVRSHLWNTENPAYWAKDISYYISSSIRRFAWFSPFVQI